MKRLILNRLPKYTGDTSPIHNSVKVLADGCLVIAAPLTTSLKSVDDLKVAEGENKRCGFQKSEKQATEQQLKDLLAAWYIQS